MCHEDLEAARVELQEEDTMFAMVLTEWFKDDPNYEDVGLAAGKNITV